MATANNTATAAVSTANNDVGESLASIASLEALPIGHRNAANTQAGLNTAIKYIDMWFKHKGVHERFNTLPDNLPIDHLQRTFDHLFSWLARTAFPVRTPSGHMVPSGKELKYKQIKSVFMKKFPNHPLFKDELYWSTMTKEFTAMCANAKITDTNVYDVRSQIPLYRRIDDTLIRQKYRGDPTSLVDALALSFSFVVNGSENSCHKLAEQNLCRNAIGRGGEHLFLRFDESYWDELFRAFDLDWPIVKQKTTKCSLHFCDYDEPYLCSFFGLGVYFLTGGLRRSGVNSTVADYIFPDLFDIPPNAVATNLSNSITQHLKVKYGMKKAKEITTRSSRKGGMTESRCNRDLDRSHEYARSGHTGPDCNPVSVCVCNIVLCDIILCTSTYHLFLRMQRVIFKLLLQWLHLGEGL
jgi:hypothetical protein